jgi:hypothetical protein
VQTLAVYRMEIQPGIGEAPEECARGICGLFSKFVIEFYRRIGHVILPLSFDGRADRPGQGHSIVAAYFSCEEHSLATVDWEIAVPEDRYYAWNVSFSCGTDRRRVEVQYRTEIGLKSLLVAPEKVEMKVQLALIMPAEFLSSVLAMRTGTIDGWPVPVAVEFLGPNDVDAFVDRILLHPKRTLPVILLAADGRFQTTPQGMQELQRYLLGAAHLAALTSPAATERLARRLGSQWACNQGVLRIYYPLCALDSAPKDHPVIRARDFAGKKIEAALHMWAMKLQVQRVPEGPITRAARAAVCGELSNYSEQLPFLLAVRPGQRTKFHFGKVFTVCASNCRKAAQARSSRSRSNRSKNSMHTFLG